MPYTVRAHTGDCLCTIAFRRGLTDCRGIRNVAANAAFLDAVLQQDDVITLPDPPLFSLQGLSKLTGGTAWIVQLPPMRTQASTVQFIRKSGDAPALPAAINDIGVSRFVPHSVRSSGENGWVNDTQRNYSAASNADPNTFSVAVHDPNPGGTTASVVLEALKPLYGHGGAITGHARYPAGPLRAARSLAVTAEKLPALAATDDFWSCELRLVVHRADKQIRPAQTLWIADLFDEENPEDVQILDHDILARYEYAACPNPAGTKCLLARTTLPLRRGESVGLEIRVIRETADGTGDDNGIVTRSAVRNRVARNCRRFYAQEELTFTIDRLETIDPPSDMLVVGEPYGPLAAGRRPESDLQGRVVLRIRRTLYNGTTQDYDIPAVAVATGNTPAQTAGMIVTAINDACNDEVRAAASPNPAEGAEPRGCVDILLTAAEGRASVTALSDVAEQDRAQIVIRVAFRIDQMEDGDQSADEMRRGAPPMRRLLFKSATIHASRINIWVVNEDRGGLTTTALRYLRGANLETGAAVRNCITMKRQAMDEDLDFLAVTLPHEIAHALADCDHVPSNVDNQSLLHPGQYIGGVWYDDKRISGPGLADHAVMRISNVPVNDTWVVAPEDGPSGASPLGVTTLQTTLHALIAANASITRTPR